MRTILEERRSGKNSDIPSYCTANPQVLKAILIHAKETETTVLIEATANQVNQFGGYTGMMPEDYKNYIWNMADEMGCRRENIILGGDHLGPLTWADEPEKDAMAKAKELVIKRQMNGTKVNTESRSMIPQVLFSIT